MANLYDKWVVMPWTQLWADDNMAFIILDHGDKYEVVSDNGEYQLGYYKNDLGDAMDLWNRAINQYLDRKLATA